MMDEEAATGRLPQGDETTPLLRKDDAPATQDGHGNEATTSNSPLADNVEGTADGVDGQGDQQIKKRRRLRWIALVVSGVIIIAFVVILIVSGVLSGGGPKKPADPDKPKMNYTICTTPACVHASSEILNNLSPNYRDIDPCTNFDTLVCEGFNNNHEIPPDRSSYMTSHVMMEENQVILRNILETPYPATSEHSPFSPHNLELYEAETDKDNFAKMLTAYNSCMDKATLDKVGVTPLVDLIHQITDLFPVSPGDRGIITDLNHANISKTFLFMQQNDITSFERLFAASDDKNPELVIIQAYPSGLTLPSIESYTDNKTLAKFETMLSAIFSDLLPTNYSRGIAPDLAKSVVDLEKKIAAVTPPVEDQQDVTEYYDIVNLTEVRELAPAIGLDSIVKGLVPNEYSAESMLLAFPHFLSNVSSIVSNTTRATLQSYMVWQTIYAYAPNVNAPEIEPVLKFNNEMAGRDPTAKPERFKECLGFVDSSLGWVLSRFYVEAAFSERAKNFGDEVIHDIKDQFVSRLLGLEWMEESVKKLAIEKVNNIKQKVGYPVESPDIMDPEALGRYYAGLEMGTSFFNNSLASRAWSVNQTWSTLGKPVDHGRWDMSSDVINAYFDPVGNDIVFPAAILQFPVFSVDLPSYISYGSFASVAGHELSHAFDNSGRHYDQTGKYTDWWTNRTVDQFTERADCFVRQYGNFSFINDDADRPLHVNGRLTLGENLADAGGITAAFAAWKQRRDQALASLGKTNSTGAAPVDQDLPGLSFFTHEQLFFVFYANFWCGKIRHEAAETSLRTDPHAPTAARILGTTANSRAFRESFNCPVKEPTCELW